MKIKEKKKESREESGEERKRIIKGGRGGINEFDIVRHKWYITELSKAHW